MRRILIGSFLVMGAILAASGTTAHAQSIGIPIVKTKDGLEVYKVTPLSLAAQMKLQKGDVILKVNGERVKTEKGFEEAVRKHAKDLTIQYRRGGSEPPQIRGVIVWPRSDKDNGEKTDSNLRSREVKKSSTTDTFYWKSSKVFGDNRDRALFLHKREEKRKK